MNRFPGATNTPPVTHAMRNPNFSGAELEVQAVARRRANNQLLRVPWTKFRRAFEEYPRWQALVLWVQAIVATQDGIPSWLLTDLRKRCPGFIEHEATSREPKLVALHFLEWVHNQEFGYAKRQGWLDALTFYGVRHPRSESAWAYREHCEEEWHGRRPSSYPKFENWLRLAQKYNLGQELNVANVADAVERYIERKMFVCWLQPLARARIELPRRVAGELERRCPGFLTPRNSDNIKSRDGRASGGERLMTWIEDHFFSQAKNEGCFDVILIQARNHPLYARIVQYSKQWNKSWSENPTALYPSLAQWRRAAENYVEV